MTLHLAQFNYARLRHPVDDPRTKGFVDGSDVLMRVAQRSAGFIWALDSGRGGVPDPPVWGDPLISVNLTVWRDPESLEFYVHKTLHKSWLKRRDEWFEPVPEPYLVMWWIEAGHIPSIEEGLDRLALLRAEGESERAFSWRWARNRARTALRSADAAP